MPKKKTIGRRPPKRPPAQPPESVAWNVARHIAPKITRAMLSIRPTEALILRSQAAVLAYLSEDSRYQQAGFGTIEAFALECLKISPSTAKQRRRLDCILRACPAAEKAFLDGRLTICKVLAIKKALEAEPQKAEKWIERARRLDVRRLCRLISKKFRDAPDREPKSVISFHAPPMVHSVFEEVVELGRMQLGYNAPVHKVIKALLFETGLAGLAGDLPEEEPKPRRKRAPVVPEGTPPPPSEALARVAKTMEKLAEYLKHVDAVCLSGAPATVFEAIDQFDLLRNLEKPLRIFQAHLLRDIRETRALQVLGYRRVSDFVETHLGVSERTARNMVADAELFEDIPAMEEAYIRSEVSLAKAHWIKCLTYGVGDKAFNKRASELTDRQFTRESRFLLRLRQCVPELGRRFRGPLPQPCLEEAFVQELCREGVGKEDIERALVDRDIEPIAEGCSLDPAENPMVMHRLEALLDMLIAEHWEDPPEVDEPRTVSDRQTFARKRRPVLIRIQAPREVVADLRAAIDMIKQWLGPGALDWHAAMVLFAHVLREWSLYDPETKPRHFRIFKRDRYLCQAPACPKRKDLHAHHMEYRSRGGSNDPTNLLPLCYHDHQGVIHARYARVSGEAPQRLYWELGCRPGREPLLILNGEKVVGGTRAGVPPPCDVRRIFGK